MAQDLKTVSVRLPQDRYEQLRWLAEQRGMPVAILIRTMVYDELAMVGMAEVMQKSDPTKPIPKLRDLGVKWDPHDPER